MKAHQRQTLVADFFAVFVVIGTVYIGLFKGALNFPLDLTVVFASLTVVASLHVLIGNGMSVRISRGGAAFVALCVPAMLAPLLSPDALATRIRLFIPLIVVIGVGTLLKTRRRQRMWVWGHVIVGVLLVATGASNAQELGRFSGAASNTIGAGRAAGVAIVVLAILIAASRSNIFIRLAGLGVIAWLVQALVSTGSRGPVFSCAAAILCVALFAPGKRRLIRLVGAAAVVAYGAYVIRTNSTFAAARLLLTGDPSSEARANLWSLSWQTIETHPFGIGWGNFWWVLPPGAELASGYRQYAHNLVLEIMVEAGWMAGIASVVLILWSLIRLRGRAIDRYGAALFGIAIFFVLNAMVSGDLNDNRMMWAAVAVAWVGVSSNVPQHMADSTSSFRDRTVLMVD